MALVCRYVSRHWGDYCGCYYYYYYSQKYTFILFSQASHGRSYNIETDNSSFERLEQFKYLGTTLTNKNSMQGDIKSRLKSGSACYHSVQNVLCYSLVYKDIKIKIYGTVMLPVVFMVGNLVAHIQGGT